MEAEGEEEATGEVAEEEDIEAAIAAVVATAEEEVEGATVATTTTTTREVVEAEMEEGDSAGAPDSETETAIEIMTETEEEVTEEEVVTETEIVIEMAMGADLVAEEAAEVISSIETEIGVKTVEGQFRSFRGTRSLRGRSWSLRRLLQSSKDALISLEVVLRTLSEKRKKERKNPKLRREMKGGDVEGQEVAILMRLMTRSLQEGVWLSQAA